MAVKEDVKAAIAKAGWTLNAVNEELNRRYNTKYTVQNLSNKLSRGSLQYREAFEIADYWVRDRMETQKELSQMVFFSSSSLCSYVLMT